MNLSAPFILRPVMTTLVVAAIVALGVAAFLRIPVSNLPDVNFPTITVTVNFPGINPITMANTVATPLEKQFMTIQGVKYVTSTSTLGNTSIVIQFDIDKDVDLAAVDVNSAIVAAKAQLPPNLPQDPIYRKVNPSATPIVYLAVTSPTMTRGEIYDYANTFIGQRISTIEGVAQVFVYGSPKAVRAQVDPGLLASLGLTQQTIAAAIGAANSYLPLGQFDGLNRASVVYDNGGLLTADSYLPLIAAYRDGAAVRLEDLGVVVESLQNDRASRRFITAAVDQPCVTLAIQREPGANTVLVADAVHKLLNDVKGQLPGSLDLVVVFDRSESIRASIHDVEFTLFLAFLLVVLVIFVYLGKIRETIIPSLVMPMSIIATIAVIYYIGYTLDNLSLLALTLAIGFIIDDAIVVLENIVRRVEMGEDPTTASLEGSKQIGFTIVSMTMSLIAVFLPLIFMAGLIGKLFQEFAVTLTIVTIASGIISLTLTPMLCSRFIPPHHKGKERGMAGFSVRLNAWMLHHYERGLKWALAHRRFMLGVGTLSVLLSALFFKILPTDFIPDEDIGFIIAYTEAEQGTSSDQMAEYQTQVAELLRHDPAIAAIMSISSNPEYRQGLLFLSLKPLSQRKNISQLIPEYMQRVKEIPGVNVYFKNVPLIDLNVGPSVRGSFQYLMQSLDSKELYEASLALMEKMRHDPTFVGVSSDLEIKTPQINLDIHRDQAYALGVDTRTLEQSLTFGLSGNRVSRIQTPIDQYDVILEFDRDLQRNDSSLNMIYLPSSTGQMVPLSAVATWTEGVGPASINHFAQFPSVTITFSLAPGVPLSIGLERMRQLADEASSHAVSGNVRGAAETFEEAIQSVTILLIITLFSIYIILGILYESFIHPLTILSTLPPAILGGLMILWMTGRPLSLYAYLGIILLIGIVKKNGIMMVDFALENVRHKGESAKKSIYDACLVRFRPIMMTTVAAIMGAVPIALAFGTGAESRRPLGLVIIGGLVVAQLITLFLTPVIYLYFEEWRERREHKRAPLKTRVD